MTTRSELKTHAKSVLTPNYWKIVLVSFILLLIAGGNPGSAANPGQLVNQTIQYSQNMDETDPMEGFVFRDGTLSVYSNFYPPFNTIRHGVTSLLSRASAFLVIPFALTAALLAICVNIFLLLPLQVGIQRFFLVSQHFPAKLRELTYSFDTEYWNTVQVMLWRVVKVFLWTLLFVIPGIVKTYEYRMIPYLLAEHPELSGEELFAASRQLMQGNKWRAFVLDLSFLPWHLLNGITFGIVGILYVNPYQSLTNAAFYEAVCKEKHA